MAGGSWIRIHSPAPRCLADRSSPHSPVPAPTAKHHCRSAWAHTFPAGSRTSRPTLSRSAPRLCKPSRRTRKYLVNIASSEPRFLDRSIANLAGTFQRGLALGAEGVIIHAGHPGEDSRDEGLRRARGILLGKGTIGLEGFRALVRHPIARRVPMLVETRPDGIAEDIATLRSLAGA